MQNHMSNSYRLLKTIGLTMAVMLSLSLASCGGKSAENENIPTDTIAPPTPQVRPVGPAKRFSGVIVGNGVRARNSPNQSGEVVRPLNTGTKVRAIGASEKRDKITSGSNCDDFGFYWYNVEVGSSEPVWVFGKFVYSLDEMQPAVYDQQVTFNEKAYSIVRAIENSYGPNDESGLTGCDTRMVLFLQSSDGKLTPIQLGKASSISRLKKASESVGSGLLILTYESDAHSEELLSTAETQFQGLDATELRFNIASQTGKGTLSLTIVPKEEGFEVADAKEVWE